MDCNKFYCADCKIWVSNKWVLNCDCCKHIIRNNDNTRFICDECFTTDDYKKNIIYVNGNRFTMCNDCLNDKNLTLDNIHDEETKWLIKHLSNDEFKNIMNLHREKWFDVL